MEYAQSYKLARNWRIHPGIDSPTTDSTEVQVQKVPSEFMANFRIISGSKGSKP